MTDHLWTMGDMPPEYTDVILMREFGWTVRELRETPATEIMTIITVLSVESKLLKKRT